MNALMTWLGNNLAKLFEYWNLLNESGLWLWALGFAFILAFACMYFAKPLYYRARALGFVLLWALAALGFVWLLGSRQEAEVTVWLNNAPKAGISLFLPDGKVISDQNGRIFLKNSQGLSLKSARAESDIYAVLDAGLRGKRGFVSLAWLPDAPVLEGAEAGVFKGQTGENRLRFRFVDKNGGNIALNRHAVMLNGENVEVVKTASGPAFASSVEFLANVANSGRHVLDLSYPTPAGAAKATYTLFVPQSILPENKPAPVSATLSSATPMGQYLSTVSTTFLVKKGTSVVGQLLQSLPNVPMKLSFRAYREDSGSSLIIFFGNYRFDVGGSDGRSISRFVHDAGGQPMKESGVYSKPITFQLVEKRNLDVILKYTPQNGESYPSLTISLEQQGRQNNPPFESRRGEYTFDFPRNAFLSEGSPRILLGAASIPAKDSPAESALRITDIAITPL